MTTTIPSPTAVLPEPRLVRHYRQSFGRVIRFEWIKFRTLRASWVGQALLVALLIGFSALAAAMSNNRMGDTGRAGRFAEMGPVAIVLTGANLGVLVVGVLGCILGAREYGSRMIASTVAAVPRRWQVVLSKAVVLTAVLLVSTLVGVFGAFFLGMSVLHSGGNHTALGDPGVLRQVVGMAGYLTAAGLLGMGLGILLRSVAGSIGVLIAGLLVLPQLAGALLPASWDPALKYLPSSSAAAFTTIDRAGTDVLSSGAGAAVLVVWVLAVVGGAVWAISRRDV